MEITPEQFARIAHCLPTQRRNVSMTNLQVLDHPLIQCKLTRMRDVATDNETFRRLLDELMRIVAR